MRVWLQNVLRRIFMVSVDEMGRCPYTGRRVRLYSDAFQTLWVGTPRWNAIKL